MLLECLLHESYVATYRDGRMGDISLNVQYFDLAYTNSSIPETSAQNRECDCKTRNWHGLLQVACFRKYELELP